MKKLTIILFLVLSLGLTACGSSRTNWATEPVQIHKKSPVVYIHPLANTFSHASVGVLDFQVPANMSFAQGQGVAGLFKDVMLGRRAFPRVVGLGKSYSSIDEARDMGRQAGVDLVLAGKINCALEGSQFGGGRVELATRMVHVESGNTVWYVEQAMDQPMDYPEVGFWSRFGGSFNPPEVRRSQAGPVLANMMAQMAYDMVDVMQGAGRVQRVN